MEIEELIKNYQPDENLVNLVKKTKIVLLCGISGAGKSSIQSRLLEKDSKLTRIVTSTTRPLRNNNGISERDGVDYYFFSQQQAIDKLAKGEYFEVAQVHDKVYGVTADEIKRIHDADKTALASIDYQGVEYFHKYHPGARAIFIVPPSYQGWYDRIKNRYHDQQEFESVLSVRKASALVELNWALNTDYCRFLINDDLDAAVEQAHAMINGQLIDDQLARRAAEQILSSIK